LGHLLSLAKLLKKPHPLTRPHQAHRETRYMASMRSVTDVPAAFLAFGGEAATVSRTGYITAFARSLSRRSDPPEIANDDRLADVFLLPVYRLLMRAPRLTRRLFDAATPGAVAYFNARTRHIDAIVQERIAAGIDQLVVLGAGFDSRAMRFDAELGQTRVFEVDVADVIALKAHHLAMAGQRLPGRVTQIAIDFSTERLDKLLSHGFRPTARTLFLWEGVTTYLRDEDVTGVLRFVREHGGPGSTLVFDYVTRAFFEGDHSAYGSRQLARGWRRMGNVNRSAIASVHDRLAPLGFTVLSDLGPAELERLYSTPARQPPHRVWGALRIAHAGVS
jgi:methyltransferase (TIGR00027 family)